MKLTEVELNTSSSGFMELCENILQLYIKRRLVLIKTAASHLHLITPESLYHNCSVSHDSHSWLSGSSMLIHLRAGVKTLQGCTKYSLLTNAAPIAVWFVIPKRILKCGYKLQCNVNPSGFGGLGVACWPLVPKFAGSNPAEAVGFLGRKNPQHAFLRRGSKAVGPMS